MTAKVRGYCYRGREKSNKSKKSEPGRKASAFLFLPDQGEFSLEECGLSCGGLFACAAYGFSLPASEGNFVNEVFASGWATRFPRYEDVSGDETADGRG